MIKCLVFVDDLVPLSPSLEELQKSLNSVQKHAEKLKLKVNTEKTNIMVFSSNGAMQIQFHFCLQLLVNLL